MPGSVASGTFCTNPYKQKYCRERSDHLQSAGGLFVRTTGGLFVRTTGSLFVWNTQKHAI